MASQLEVITAPAVERVYMDNGTGADTDISVFQAQVSTIPAGYFMIGSIAVNNHTNTIPSSSVILVKPLVPDAISQPIGYDLTWNDKGSGGSRDGSFWRVQPPANYVALGDVALSDYGPPSSDFTAKYACIRADLVRTGVLNSTPIWTDRGCRAPMDGSVWKVEGKGLAGYFKAQRGYSMPAEEVFVLPATASSQD